MQSQHNTIAIQQRLHSDNLSLFPVSPVATAAGKVNPDINPNLFPNLYFVTDGDIYTASRSPLWKKIMDT